LWAAYRGFSALSYLLHAISPRWKFSASSPPAIFFAPTGFPQGVSRGGGEVRKNGARLWGWTPHYTWFPTSADRIHTLAHPGTDTPSASAAGGRQGGGRRDTKAEPGAKVNLAPFGIGGWGKRASSGFLTPMVFQVTTRGGQVGRYFAKPNFREDGDLHLQWRACPGGLLPLDAEPLWGPSPKWTSGGKGRTRIRSRASLGMAGVEL
jgi:hypothetical protein